MRGFKIIFLGIVTSLSGIAQTANYVNNGGLEDKYSCNVLNGTSSYIINAKYWDEIDSAWATRYSNTCIGDVPYNGFGFQYPRTGNAYVIADFACATCSVDDDRAFARNKLKAKLEQNKTYCVTFYVNLGNQSSYAIDAIQACFYDNSLDSIKYGHRALTYLVPQINNITGNYISDTLNWIKIRGTFVATGIETYMVIGNFKTLANTNMINVIPSYSNNAFTTISIDDVSCIPIDLPAFAGPDKSCVLGDSVFIGRQPDVGIDEDCMWYKLPVIITPKTPAIDTVAGLWVKPVVTTTYVVRQEICGIVKFDTVVVYKDYLGLNESKWKGENIDIFPNPACKIITIKGKFENENIVIKIADVSGRCVLEREFRAEADQITLEVELQNGIYLAEVISQRNERITKKLAISN